jgi:hypothetical protein
MESYLVTQLAQKFGQEHYKCHQHQNPWLYQFTADDYGNCLKAVVSKIFLQEYLKLLSQWKVQHVSKNVQNMTCTGLLANQIVSIWWHAQCWRVWRFFSSYLNIVNSLTKTPINVEQPLFRFQEINEVNVRTTLILAPW